MRNGNACRIGLNPPKICAGFLGSRPDGTASAGRGDYRERRVPFIDVSYSRSLTTICPLTTAKRTVEQSVIGGELARLRSDSTETGCSCCPIISTKNCRHGQE